MAASDTRQEGTVYIRVTRGKVDPSRYADVKGLGREIAVAISRLPGAQDYHGGGDAATGRILAFSTWDNEAHARFPREAMGPIVEKLQALGVQLQPPEIYQTFT